MQDESFEYFYRVFANVDGLAVHLGVAGHVGRIGIELAPSIVAFLLWLLHYLADQCRLSQGEKWGI